MANSSPAVDVLIIGAGPTGAVASKRLAEAGMSVVVLEQGDWPDYTRARADHADFEITAGKYWGANPNRRKAPADYPVDDSDSDIAAVIYNAVGGSSVIFAAHWQRNMPSDFRVRTLDGVGDDWPLTYEDLEPYYEAVEEDFGISGLAGDPAFPPGKGPPLPPAPLGAMGRRVARAHNELGWHWWPAPNAIATRPYRGLGMCTQRATCMWGCVEGAKGSADRTHWPGN
ncbi:MAG: GMC family oxidoreductase, partial [Planctomycetaceae bacterium]|nr:GMC family oxidoreductase [Planctomycetaceae bacterium]